LYEALPPLTPRQRGDYQTPHDLARQVWETLKGAQFDLVIEPTFGMGSFFETMPATCNAAVIGWEIHQEYYWATVEGVASNRRQYDLYHGDILDASIADIVAPLGGDILVIGNPPWVTNAEQGVLGGRNTGGKVNLKNLPGLDALTGKANFDIAEAIILHLLTVTRAYRSVQFALLVKFSVARNLLLFLERDSQIGDFEFHRIDTQRHFGASVDAGLLKFRCGAYVRALGRCIIYDILGQEAHKEIGIIDQHVIYDLQTYNRYAALGRKDVTPYVWRQGVKHDLREVFELQEVNDAFWNHRHEPVVIESELLYQLYKGSDVFHGRKSRFVIPLYQRDLQDDLRDVAEQYPLAWNYLQNHAADFAARKSRIYQKRPPFSLFGIGDYTYRRYKVAISALHSEPVFRLLPPSPRISIVDDTCYIIATDDEREAAYLLAILTLDCVRDFLMAISYPGDKRRFSKDVLSRVHIPSIDSCPPKLVDEEVWFLSYRSAILQPPLFVAD